MTTEYKGIYDHLSPDNQNQNVCCQNIDHTLSRIFLEIIFNWDQIKDNCNVMETVNMNTNTMCKYMKLNNCNVDNHIIQAYVLSFLIVLSLIMPIPISGIDTVCHVKRVIGSINSINESDTANLWADMDVYNLGVD